MNEDLCAELGLVRESLQSVADSIQQLVPRGELDRASDAVIEDNRRWRRSVILLIIGGPLLFLVNLAVLYQGHVSEVSFRKDIHQGVACVLGEISTHRYDSRTFEHDTADVLHIPNFEERLHLPSPVPEESLNDLVQRCGPVIRRFIASDALTGQRWDPQIPLRAEGGKHG